MQQLQFSESHFAAVEKIQKTFSEQEWTTIDQAFMKLVEQGLTQTPDNYMTIVRTYNNNPNVKITVDEVVRMVTADNNRQYFKWLSKDELEYGKLAAELGEVQTQQVHKLLSNYSLYSTGEEGMKNFNLVVSYAKAQGWPITSTSYALIERLRNTPKGTGLEFRPTPEQIRKQKERDDVRNATPPKKTPLEMAKLRADQVRGLRDPLTGRDLAEIEMEKFYETHPLEQTPAAPAPADDSVNPENSVWQRRTLDWIGSPQIRSSQRADLMEKFGKAAIGGNWRLNYLYLESYLQKQKDEASIQRQLEADRAKMGIRG